MEDTQTMKRRFLSAEWRYLTMLNYEIDPALVRPLVPRGVELDCWNGRHFVSLVGFLFLRTLVLGIPIPFHRNFEEVNLRFYVRRKVGDGWRRGVVFVREVVPRLAIALVARWIYNEQYVALPMGSTIRLPGETPGSLGMVEYTWTSRAQRNALRAEFAGTPSLPAAGSEEEFITEHYWGYVGQRNGTCLEYEVAHPQWRVWRATSARLECDVQGFYGAQYHPALVQPPSSAFVAEGSAIAVYKGDTLRK